MTDDARIRVLVLTADVGEGHASAARALVAEIETECERADVTIADGLTALGGFLRRLLRDGYRMQLRWAPWLYGLTYFLFTRVAPLRALGRFGLGFLGSRGVLALVAAHDPDVVVSTFPGLTTVLGRLRRLGKIQVPVVATVTDLGVHPLWAHRGIDLHLVMDERCREPVERVAGAGSARAVYPLVLPLFRLPIDRPAARRALGLPRHVPVVLVSGGGWGVGDLAGAVTAALGLPGATVVCVCGRNDDVRRRLEARFAGERRVVVLGFTGAMSTLLAAADALVHSTGGVTCLEALVRRCPIVAYGAPPGHARGNARAMAALRLGATADSPEELAQALFSALARGRPRPRLSPTRAASLVVSATPRIRPLPAWRPIAARTAAAAAATVLAGGWTFQSDDPFPLVARTLDLDPITHVATPSHAVALVLRTPPGTVHAAARALARRGAHASFAFSSAPGNRTLALVALRGDEPIPELGSGGTTRWLDTRDRLHAEARALGLRHVSLFLTPASGFDLGQYVFARTIDASPVAGAVVVGPEAPRAQLSPRPGDVVVVTLASPASAERTLGVVFASLRARGLAAVSLRDLIASGRDAASTAAERVSAAPPATTSASDPTSSTMLSGVDVHASARTSGARMTGVTVWTAKTTGATRAAGAI